MFATVIITIMTKTIKAKASNACTSKLAASKAVRKEKKPTIPKALHVCGVDGCGADVKRDMWHRRATKHGHGLVGKFECPNAWLRICGHDSI